MPKNNKITTRLFAKSRNDYLEFLNFDETLGLTESNFLIQMKQAYEELLRENKEQLQKFSLLEEIIIQIRCREVIYEELRLSLSRDYIYARSLFYRKSKQINDIRVLIGKTSEYGNELDELLQDTNFRILCKEKLTEAMNKDISINVILLNLVNVNE